MEHRTPYFLIDKKSLDKNIIDFKNALSSIWPNSQLSYSVKTNSLPWLLEYLNSLNVYAEVVSDEEYLLARKCGFDYKNIIFNGPIKGNQLFLDALKNGSIINVDSKNDLELLSIEGKTFTDTLGIRVNPNPNIFKKKDIGYSEDGFRFGFSEDTGELDKAIDIVRSSSDSIGLHLHCNSITRSKDVYIALAKYASNIIKKYSLNVSYIDMGGGFFGGVPGKTTPLEYISAIKKEFENVVDINQTKLYVEPGSAVIGSVVDLVTSVVDVKDTSNARIVTTDGSRIHIDPLWVKKGYMYSLKTKKETKMNKQIICGYTCMDHDRLMSIVDENELSIGDKITYHRVGAYSMTFGGMFIRYYPEVYICDSGRIERVRNKITVDDYYSIHSNKN